MLCQQIVTRKFALQKSVLALQLHVVKTCPKSFISSENPSRRIYKLLLSAFRFIFTITLQSFFIPSLPSFFFLMTILSISESPHHKINTQCILPSIFSSLNSDLEYKKQNSLTCSLYSPAHSIRTCAFWCWVSDPHAFDPTLSTVSYSSNKTLITYA